LVLLHHPMKKFVLAPALAALAMFFWGFLYWGAPHHLPYKSLGHLQDETAAANALSQIFPATGAYLIPHPMNGDENMAKQMSHGPTVEVHIVKEGMAAMDPAMLVKGYMHGFVVAVFLMVLLSSVAAAVPTWFSRVRVCTLVGVLVGLCDVADAIWWHHSVGWSFAQAFYDFVLFVVAGLVLAKFVKPAAVEKLSPTHAL
jgi:hypothetical protein